MKRIFNQIPSGDALPKHIAIIMDGNGRWAKARRLPRSAGHSAGTDRVTEIVRTCSDIGIKSLTLFAFSTENWSRPKEEVDFLMMLLSETLRKKMMEMHENNVIFRQIGDREALPDSVLKPILEAEELMSKNTGLILNFGFNYGARDELIRAAKLASEKCGGSGVITKELFEECLYTKESGDVDLLIRTGGEKRISNFLLYQIAYAELYFTDVYWPDFDSEELFLALRSFAGRQRRFGGLKEE